MKKTMLFLAAFGLAVAVSAQLPTSQQSSSPTSNSFRMKIVSPLEGATIQGPDFDIVLGQPVVPPSGTSVSPEERKDSLTPIYQVWIDGKDFGKIPIGENVLHVTGVSTGSHKIVIAAKNAAGELIDRKELGVSTTGTAIAQTTETSHTMTAPAPAPAYVPPPAPASAPAPQMQAQYTTESSSLPKTGTSYPLAAAAGLALLAAGLVARRIS